MIGATGASGSARGDAVEDDEAQRKSPRWITLNTVSTLVLAMIIAVGILLSGITLNQFLVQRTAEVMDVSKLNADRISIEILESKHDVLTSLGLSPDEAEIERIREYRRHAEEMNARIAEEGEGGEVSLREHELFAVGVALLSIAITMSAVSNLLKEKRIWMAGLAFGFVGSGFVIAGVSEMLFA